MASTEIVVRDLVNEIALKNKLNLKDIDIQPISSDGGNYTTDIYAIKLITDKETIDLFAKVASIVGEMRKELNADRLYKTEEFVYDKLVKIFEAIQDKHSVPREHRFVFPKCYGLNRERGQETVVLENLMPKGYETCNRFKSMDWAHATVSVELLAKFHALSFAYNKENPEEFQELAADLAYRGGLNDVSEKITSMWVKMVDQAVQVIDDEYKDRVRNLTLQKEFLQKYKNPSERPVLCHGDFKLSNILFLGKGGYLRAILVDYQTVYSGSPAADLVFFIAMGSDEEFRREHYEALVEHYYRSLCRELQTLHLDPLEAYPRETFDRHMREALPYAIFAGIAMLPSVLVEAAEASRLGRAAEPSCLLVPPGALYAARLRGLVADCARWGAF